MKRERNDYSVSIEKLAVLLQTGNVMYRVQETFNPVGSNPAVLKNEGGGVTHSASLSERQSSCEQPVPVWRHSSFQKRFLHMFRGL